MAQQFCSATHPSYAVEVSLLISSVSRIREKGHGKKIEKILQKIFCFWIGPENFHATLWSKVNQACVFRFMPSRALWTKKAYNKTSFKFNFEKDREMAENERINERT